MQTSASRRTRSENSARSFTKRGFVVEDVWHILRDELIMAFPPKGIRDK
jgi:hypothetical protein